MPCYCKERDSNPKLAEKMKDIPKGYCGLCDICGEPGHMCAHPRLSTTGAWCDEHWNELEKNRVFTLADLVQYALYAFIVGTFIYSVISAWKSLAPNL